MSRLRFRDGGRSFLAGTLLAALLPLGGCGLFTTSTSSSGVGADSDAPLLGLGAGESQPTPRAPLTANTALSLLEGAPPWNPLIKPASTDTFLAQIAYPEEPATGLNPDGTLKSNPVKDLGVVTVDSTDYDLRTLTSDVSIKWGGRNVTVYSAVPVTATTDYAYQNLASYYLNNATDAHHPDLMPTTAVPGKANSGNTTSLAPTPVSSSYDSGTPVYLASNNPTDDPLFFLPNLPNGRDGNGYTDHLGLTENVAWSFNPFLYTLKNGVYDTGRFWRFCHGWASPAENAAQTVQWNRMDDHNLVQTNPGGAPPLALDSNSGEDVVSATIKALNGKTLPELTTLFTGWVNTNANLDNSFWTAVQQQPNWLSHGAFITYQPMPGFQCNLLRQHTPAGTYTVAENTSGLFVQNSGKVEMPAAYSGPNVTGPVPLVSQTWTDQRFVLYNNLTQVVPSTQDSYPGEEYYYLGNTYLPGKAGLVNRWTHFPKITLKSTGGGDIPDERDTDCWLGLQGDHPWDVMAWMVGYTTPPSSLLPHTNDLGLIDLGGQARKPYMLGASQQVTSTTNGQVQEGLRLQHSNSFWWAQVPPTDSSRAQMYASTMYMDPDGDGPTDYLPVVTLWWTWKAQSFADSNHVYVWQNQKSGSTLGTWVPQFKWLVKNGTTSPPFTAQGFPAGWLNQLPGPAGTAVTNGTSASPNVFALAGPAPTGATSGSSLSLTINEAGIPAGAAAQAITWTPPTAGPFSAANATASHQPTDGSGINLVGKSVQLCTVKGISAIGSSPRLCPRFLIVLSPVPQ